MGKVVDSWIVECNEMSFIVDADELDDIELYGEPVYIDYELDYEEWLDNYHK